MRNRSRLNSNLVTGMDMGNILDDRNGLFGEVTLQCFDSEGNLKWTEVKHNIVTTVGDNYYAAQAVTGVAPANSSAPPPVTCMKLGNAGSPATDSKTGTGAGIEGYVTGSNKAFDASYPDVDGNDVLYRVTWEPGEGTDSNISNIAICFTDADSTSAAADCIARATISPARNKQAADTLVATWTHTFLGA